MKNIICLILILLSLYSCKKEIVLNSSNKINNSRENKDLLLNHFDEIIHYTIIDEVANKNETIERFEEIFMGVHGHKMNFKTFEKELISFGYLKKVVPKGNIQKIDEFLSNEIYYDGHLAACVPSYRDILILKKNGKIIAILKLCFECGMIDKYGVIKSSYGDNVDFDNYFINFESFYKTLHNIDYKR